MTNTSPVVTPRAFRLQAAADYIGVSSAHLKKLDAEGTGPRKTRLGTRAVGWLRDDLDAWLEKQRDLYLGADVTIRRGTEDAPEFRTISGNRMVSETELTSKEIGELRQQGVVRLANEADRAALDAAERARERAEAAELARERAEAEEDAALEGSATST